MTFVLKYFWQILSVVLLIIVCTSVRQCQVGKDDNEVLSHANDSLYNVATYYRSKTGKLEGQVKTHELTVEQFKKYAAKLGFENEDLLKQVGKANRLVAHWKGKVEASGGGVTVLQDTVVKTDTIYIESTGFQWRNDNLSIWGVLEEPIAIGSSQIRLRYQYEARFTLTAYRKPQGWFKSPQLVADIWFDDENMKVREFSGFVIQEPRKRFIDTGLFKVSVGIGIGFVAAKSL